MNTASPRVSRWLLGWFRWYTRRYLAKHFFAVRVARAGRDHVPEREPLVVFINHASWWDPLVGMLLAERFFPGRKHFAPIDAHALGRYRFMERLGFFGIDPNTRQGAAAFLHIGRAILSQPGTALWLTPEGRFADPRRRPVQLQRGLAHLAKRLQHGVLVPVAMEYPFWEERLPEALARFGGPIRVSEHQDLDVDGWNQLLEGRLRQTQDALADQAIGRDVAKFDVLIQGSAGVGGMYDRWRGLRAWLSGREFRPEHGSNRR
jgi:1-acyl-sn-glycerol-3-phosphate acyltransferase